MAQMNDKALEELTVDYGERPSMEPLEGVTDEHRRAGSHLAAIHRMHLRDVYYIGKLLEQVFSSSITSKTSWAIAQETGLPPNVLKNSIPLLNCAATSGVQTTAATGCPFPRGFPMVTISGTTSYNSNPQK